MKFHELIAVLLVVASPLHGDMGYFGSIAQNPVPSEPLPEHGTIEMTGEDVVIEVFPGGRSQITADFLFTNTGQADTVLMYFPVSVLTPMSGILWSLQDVSDPLPSPAVSVNGIPVDVHPLLSTRWSAYGICGNTWADIQNIVDPLCSSEPGYEEDFFFMMEPDYWETLNDMNALYFSNSLSERDSTVFESNSYHACWTVSFSPGEQVLVEYTMEYHLGHPWTVSAYDLTYPLYTGASWSGSIGSGRITVIPTGGLGLKHFTSWSSVSMPEAVVYKNFTLQPISGIESAEGYSQTQFSSISGTEVEEALVWEFRDFEPEVSDCTWMYYFEGAAEYEATYYNPPEEEDSGWPSSLRVIVANAGLKENRF